MRSHSFFNYCLDPLLSHISSLLLFRLGKLRTFQLYLRYSCFGNVLSVARNKWAAALLQVASTCSSAKCADASRIRTGPALLKRAWPFLILVLTNETQPLDSAQAVSSSLKHNNKRGFKGKLKRQRKRRQRGFYLCLFPWQKHLRGNQKTF